MGRFLERQLKSAETKPLGATKNRYDYDSKTGTGRMTQYREDASKAPPLVVSHMTPVGRRSGVCKPGSESECERREKAGENIGVPAPSKRNRTP